MPKNPAFDLFEIICQELAARSATIIPEDNLSPTLLEDLKEYYDETANRTAFDRALAEPAVSDMLCAASRISRASPMTSLTTA